ncbi:hypothetical protein F5887DRAFT_918994 [Amanita rubescens]|nr:hypothetical protein F5887DRAFT_918994 [Amanita rubescens]
MPSHEASTLYSFIACTNSLEQTLQALRSQPDADEWYETRPYTNYVPGGRRVNNITAGALRGPGKLALRPLVRSGENEKEVIVLVHVGRGLCGRDGIIHGDLLVTLLDESLARMFIVIKVKLDTLEGGKASVSGRVEVPCSSMQQPRLFNPSRPSNQFSQDSQLMQLTTIIPVLLIFVSNFLEQRYYSSHLKLEAELGDLVAHSDFFESLWGQKGSQIPGIPTGSYMAFEYRDGFAGHPAIIKGIWKTVNEEEVIHEGQYLKTTEKLLTFAINDKPRDDLPNFFFIIKNPESKYVARETADLTIEDARLLRRYAKGKIVDMFTPRPAL